MSCSKYCHYNSNGRCTYKGNYYGYTDSCPADTLPFLDRCKVLGFAYADEWATLYQRQADKADGEE